MSTADLPGERWRPITGYEDMYQVSDRGRVRSLARTIECQQSSGKVYLRHFPEIVLKPIFRNGYPFVNLHNHGRKQGYIADLVAAAFLGDRSPGMLVMHLDGVKSNAAAENLAYATLRTIVAGKQRRGTVRRGERLAWARLTDEAVRIIRAAGKDVTHRALAARFGVTDGAVRLARLGETWRHVE